MYKIMIVDDNKTNLIMAKKALEDNYDVIPMSSGVMALEFDAVAPTSASSYDELGIEFYFPVETV